MDWLERAKNEYEKQELFENERKEVLTVESIKDVPDSLYGIKSVFIREKCKNNSLAVISKILERTTGQISLIINGAIRLKWSEICSQTFYNVKKLSFSLDGILGNEILIAPELEELAIYGNSELTPLELIINPMPHIDFSNMPMLKQLYLRRVQQIDPDDFKDIKGLKTLLISGSNISELGWLKDAHYKLEKLDIDDGIEDCSGIESQQELRIVRLSRNTISSFVPLETLHNLELVDLSFGENGAADSLRKLGIKTVIITRRDAEIYKIGQKVEDIVKWAVSAVRNQNARLKRLDELSSFEKKYLLLEANRSFQERMMYSIQREYNKELALIDKENRFWGTKTISKDEYKALFTQLAKQHYPFLTI